MSMNVGEIDLSLILNSDQFRKELGNIKSTADGAANKMAVPLKKIGALVAAAFSVGKIVEFGKVCVQVASETANAWIGLNSILVGQGKSFSEAKKFIQEYTKDGLVPLNNAVAAYKNLSLRGYNSEQIQKVMTALKNSATFARQSTYSLGDAVQTATEGLKNENSVVVDNAGVTKNVAKMWEEYAASIGKTRNNLTDAEKIQAEVNGILEETKFQSQDAAKYTQTYSGALAMLSTSFTNMKIAIGNVLQPIAKLFIPVLTAAANAVTRLFTAMASLLSLFGLKADSVETVASGLGDVADSATGAGNSIDKAGDKAKKSGKKAKGALASWDELNVLSQNDTSGSGSGTGSGSGGTGDIASALDMTSTLQEDTSMFDGMISRIKELVDLFKDGFNASFGETNFDGILNHLAHIKETLIDIFTAPEVVEAANNWADTVAFSLGQITGSIARIGVNIAEGLLGSIDYYLTQNSDRIKDYIIEMFNISADHFSIVGNFSQALGEISDVLKGDTAKQIGADLIAMFANPYMELEKYFAKLARDIDTLFMQPIIDNVEKIKSALENTLQPIQTVTSSIANVFTQLGDKLNEVYDGHIKPMFESLTQGFSDVFGTFLDKYNTYVAPVLQEMANKFVEVFEGKIQPMLNNLMDAFGKLADLITVVWETVLKPTAEWLINNVLPIVTTVFKTLWDSLMNFFGYVSDTLNGIIEIAQGVLDFFIGVFTGDWQLAWDGIKEIFSGTWETIKGIFMTIVSGITTIIIAFVASITAKFTLLSATLKAILEALKVIVINIWNGIKTSILNTVTMIKNGVSEGLNIVKDIFSNVFNGIWNIVKNICNSILGGVEKMVNGVINGLNRMIDAMNSLHFDIPDWVPELGGKTFGFNIPRMNEVALPRLAQGGYVKANTPQLAVIGDNKHHGEIVSPEDKMESVMMTALENFFEKLKGTTNISNDDKPIVVQLVLNGDFAALAQILKPYMDAENNRVGVQLIEGGAK